MMNARNSGVALIALGGGILAGSAVHQPQWWQGVIGLVLIAFAFFQARSRRTAALCGLIAGVAYFEVSMPFLLTGYRSIGITGFKPIIGVIALRFLLALWWPVAFAIAYGVRGAVNRAAALSVLWAAAELLRGTVFPAIPVAQIASIWSQTPMIQLSHPLTVELLSALTIAIAVSAARTISQKSIPIAEGLLLAIGGMIGASAEGAPLPSPNLPRIAVIDTAIRQSQRWDDAVLPAYMADLTARTRAAFDHDHAQIVVWPEASVPFFPEEVAALEPVRPGPGQYLVLGVMTPIEAGQFYNSLLVLDHQLAPVARYDKRHLFPFGEYLPYAELIERFLGLTTIAVSTNSLVPGRGDQSIQLPGLSGRIIPVICYEGSFALPRPAPGETGAYSIVISNDAWWDGSTGARFVEQEARMRAIEAGVPMIRIPNMHSPLIVDAHGQTTTLSALSR